MISEIEKPIQQYNTRGVITDELELIFKGLSANILKEIRDVHFIPNKEKYNMRIIKTIDVLSGRKRLRSFQDKTREFIHKHPISTSSFKSKLYPNIKINLKNEIPLNGTLVEYDSIKFKFTEAFYVKDWVFELSRSCMFMKKNANNIYKSLLFKSEDINSTKLQSFLDWNLELEYLGKGPINRDDIENIIEEVIPLTCNIENELKTELIWKNLQTISPSKYLSTTKHLSSVVTLTRKLYSDIYPHLENFYMTEKIDGIRTLIYVEGKTAYFINNNSTQTITLKDVDIKPLYLDSELNRGVYNVFDVIEHNNKKIYQLPFEDRYIYLKELLKVLTLPNTRVKEFYECSEDNLHKVYNNDLEGIIFTIKRSFGKYDAQYFNMKSYKWKNKENTTIDFLVIKSGETKTDILYTLFVGISRSMFNHLGMKKPSNYNKLLQNIHFTDNYFPIPFSIIEYKDTNIFRIHKDQDNNLDGTICEFSYNKGWNFVKKRTDRFKDLKSTRYFGNDYNTALNNFLYIKKPITETDLFNFDYRGYFKEIKDGKYFTITSYHSFVKSELFRNLKGKILLDIGAGKGQDVKKYKKYFQDTYVLDIDEFALGELERRYNKIKTICIDFTKWDFEKTYTNFFDSIICNFAFHYLFKDNEQLISVHNKIYTLLKPRGLFGLTIINGNKIKEDIELFDDGLLKYKITPSENTIDVLLPFSGGELYKETKVDINNLLSIFGRGFNCVFNKSFDNYLEKYKSVDPKKSSMLTENDKIYTSLHNVLIFQKRD